MSRLQFISLVTQMTPEGEKDFFFNGREWQQLSKPLPPIASESGVAAEEGASPDLPLEQ